MAKHKPVRFRIYPDIKSKKHHYNVVILDRSEDMFAQVDKDQGWSGFKEHNYEAICCTYTKLSVPSKEDRKQGKRTQTSPEIGTIYFYADSAARGGVVSHEMTHALMAYTRRKRNADAIFSAVANRKDDSLFSSKHEEWMCHVQGNLVAQYWHKWHRARDAGRFKKVNKRG